MIKYFDFEKDIEKIDNAILSIDSDDKENDNINSDEEKDINSNEEKDEYKEEFERQRILMNNHHEFFNKGQELE